MATNQSDDTLAIRGWMNEFSHIVRDIQELGGPKAKEEQLVVGIMKLATTFNIEWLRDLIKRFGFDPEILTPHVTENLTDLAFVREFMIEILTQLAVEDLHKRRATPEEKLRYADAREEALLAFKNTRSLGTHGQRTWTRDELHER